MFDELLRIIDQDYSLSKENKDQIIEYLNGQRKNFDKVEYKDGTVFQRQVWDEISKIPYGETRTYRDLAIAIGKPNAVRAVGTACGANRFCIIIPCHRVVGSNGGLGGYAYGLEIKKKLLELEKNNS